MDIKHPRPRQGTFATASPVVSQQLTTYSTNVTEPIASQLPAYLYDSHASFEMPNDAPVQSAKKILDTTAVAVVDYSKSAKAFKNHAIGRSIYNALLVVTVLLVFITLFIGGIGFYLNAKYVGKALPFAKIGNISVGGMDKQQIKAVLAKTSNDLSVTFVDGGLTWTVPASTFNPTYDFESAIDSSIAKSFNPYAFLLKTDTTVPVAANERHVQGYLRQNITNMQTRSEDAYIIKGTDSVTAKPEIVGFSANPAHVTEQINNSLAKMNDVKIRMNSVGVKPNVYTADLQPEITRANNMINTNVSVRYLGINASPTKKEKLDWLTIYQAPGSTTYTYDFSKAKIRDYVVSLAQKYQRPMKVEQPDNPENPAGYIVPSVVINNVEGVTNDIYQGLVNSRSVVAVFSRDNSTKRNIPVNAVAANSQNTTKQVAQYNSATNAPKTTATDRL